MWKKLLKLRSLALDMIKCVMLNENSTSLWYENQHPLGPFDSKFGNGLYLLLFLERKLTLVQVIRTGLVVDPLNGKRSQVS